jgi:hypothetical protein
MMAANLEIENALVRLKNLRNKGDFEGQLAVFKELGRLYAIQKDYTMATDYLEKATQVADYLKKSNTYEDICLSLIAIYQMNNDNEAILDVYSRLHIHFNLEDDRERATQYNNIRLDLVAKQMGKKNPDFFERFNFESKISAKYIDKHRIYYRRLLEGKIEPTIPDEYTEACYFLVNDIEQKNKFDKAMKYITMCEQLMRHPGIWVSQKGIEYIQQLKQEVEKRRRGATLDENRKIFG